MLWDSWSSACWSMAGREWFLLTVYLCQALKLRRWSVSLWLGKNGHSGDDNTVSHFTNPSPSCISMILSMRLYLIDFIGSLDYLLCRLPFSLLHFELQLRLMGWHSHSEGDLWHWEKPAGCYCIPAQALSRDFWSICKWLSLLKNLYQKCFNAVGPVLGMSLD